MNSNQNLFQRLEDKKVQLDGYRPLPAALVRNLDEWFKVELTYTSNAIEGNTLSRNETALVVEKGITVQGKSLNELLEATNTAAALDYVKGLAGQQPEDFTASDLLNIHAIVLKGIDAENAGRYRRVGVRISGSEFVPPEAVVVPGLMDDFISSIQHPGRSVHPVARAAAAHYRLVAIHPFTDGNGRTARLLMNLLLMQAGYPPAIIKPEHRVAYIDALERADANRDEVTAEFIGFVGTAVEESLDIYLQAVTGKTPELVRQDEPALVGRQALAELTGVRASTIKYYTELGILPYVQEGSGLARRYHLVEATARLEQIKRMRDQGLGLEAIATRLGAKGKGL